MPTRREVETGAAWLQREIELVEPKAIIALGKQPALELLGRYGTVRAHRLSEVTERRFQITVGRRPLAVFAA